VKWTGHSLDRCEETIRSWGQNRVGFCRGDRESWCGRILVCGRYVTSSRGCCAHGVESKLCASVSHLFLFSTSRVYLLATDLNLYSTTLRYAQSNEVATVNNGTISGSRIVNCNRSPNAVVVFDLLLHICLIEDEKAQVYVSAIEQFIHDHPRIWECVVLFRYDKFDADMEQVFCRIAVRHRNSWQDAGRILRDKGELQKFIYQLGKSMEVNFESPPARRLIYTGGTMVNGQVQNYKKNLLAPTNIENDIIDDENAGGPSPTKQVADTLFKANIKAMVGL
jgi:hypothetical protein